MPDARTVLAYPTNLLGGDISHGGTKDITFQEWSTGDDTFLAEGIPVECELRQSEITAVKVLPAVAEGLLPIVSRILMSDTCMTCDVRTSCPIGGYKEPEVE